MDLILCFLCLSVFLNAFFVHYLFFNKLEISFGDKEKIELEILQIAIEKIIETERKIDENPEIAYKAVKGIAKKASLDVLAHRNKLK